MKVVALLPMRHSSERVKGKNYRSFAGEPLYHYIVKSMMGSELIDSIYIDTDSDSIMEDAAKHFPAVNILLRPAHLRAGETPMNDVLENTISHVEADIYLQTHSTNPLLCSETIDSAIKYMLDNPGYDSLFSVTRLQTRLYDSAFRPINHDPGVLLRTQDLPPVYEENSNIYLFTKDSFMKNKNRIGSNPAIFEVPRDEAWDIDEEIDFKVAEFLYMQRSQS